MKKISIENLVFATSNKYKVAEVNQLLENITIKSLTEIGCTEDVPETSDTIKGNAIQKAEYVYKHYNVNCFSEDTGLEIDSLNGAPGIYAARYAGPERDSQANIDLVLNNLNNNLNRKARFRTVIALVIDGTILSFEGIAEGHIANEMQGEGGFGYDPIFIPEGEERTFAQMSANEKNKISHRAKALKKLVEYLKA